MIVHDLGTTKQYDGPVWTGSGFKEEEAQALWLRLPESLQKIVLEEISLGNSIEAILENLEKGIVLVSLSKGPLLNRKANDQLHIHMSHKGGNYCYDGTKATYEDIQSGCFLSFEDPEHVDNAF